LVATTDGRSFFEDGLASGTEFTYTVEPQNGGASETISLTTSGGASGSGLGSVASLELEGLVYSSSALELFWIRVNSAASYRIERDGQLIDERNASSFFDTALSSGTSFVYSVTALSQDGSVLATDTVELTTQ